MSEENTPKYSIDKIAAALAKAQSEFKPITRNKQAHWGMYADLAEIINCTMPALTANGIAVTQDVQNQEVVTYLIHSSGQALINHTPLILAERCTPPQFGSALSYARRYALQAIVNVFADIDDDAKSATDSHQKPSSATASHNKQASHSNGGEHPADLGDFVVTFGKKYNGKKLKDIPPLDLASYVDWILADIKKKNKGEPFGFMKDFLETAEDYLESLKSNSQSIRYDQDQLISFDEQTELPQ